MLPATAKALILRRHTVLRTGLLARALPYDLRWIQNKKAAGGMWRLSDDKQRHVIVLNETLDRHADRKTDLEEFALRIYFHEIGHSLFTEPDSAGIVRELRRDGLRAPFSLLNLFEDARIEARWRRLTGKPFAWGRWLQPPWEEQPGVRPLRLAELPPSLWFHYLITVEGAARAIDEALERAVDGPVIGLERLRRVIWYYRRATGRRSGFAASTAALAPLCRLWTREFGSLPREREWQRHHCRFHGGDFRRPPGEWEDPLPGDSGIMKRLRRLYGIELPSRLFGRGDYDDKSSVWIPDCNRGSFDPARGDAVETALTKAFQGGPESGVKFIFPKKRFSVRDYVRGSRRVYRGRSVTPAGLRKLLLLIDCSGSMRGAAALNGLTLLQVINRLHRKGRLRARVFLTWGPNEELRLPFEEDRLFSLSSRGDAEGFEPCLRQHEDAVRWADLVCAYTDGNITDEPVDPRRWRRLHTPAWGLYAGEKAEERAESLKRWFSHSLARPTLEELIADLVGMLRGPVMTAAGR